MEVTHNMQLKSFAYRLTRTWQPVINIAIAIFPAQRPRRHLLAGDGELSQIVVNGLKDYTSLSEMDRARFVATFMAFLSYSQNAFIKWRRLSLGRTLEPLGVTDDECGLCAWR